MAKQAEKSDKFESIVTVHINLANPDAPDQATADSQAQARLIEYLKQRGAGGEIVKMDKTGTFALAGPDEQPMIDTEKLPKILARLLRSQIFNDVGQRRADEDARLARQQRMEKERAE